MDRISREEAEQDEPTRYEDDDEPKQRPQHAILWSQQHGTTLSSKHANLTMPSPQ
jgi:hypothetical protein